MIKPFYVQALAVMDSKFEFKNQEKHIIRNRQRGEVSVLLCLTKTSVYSFFHWTLAIFKKKKEKKRLDLRKSINTIVLQELNFFEGVTA